MAFSELQKYYESTRNSYLSLLKMLEEFDKGHKEGVVEDKEFKKAKKEVEKVRNSYEVISYFFLLWSKPTPEEKELLDEWEKENKETFDYLSKRVADKTIRENKKLINDIRKYIGSK